MYLLRFKSICDIMKKNANSVVIICLLLAVLSVHSQKVVVKSQVTTFNVIGVQKAVVTAKKSKVTVLTDALGFFTIECEIKDKLTISAAGFVTKRVKVKSLSESDKIDIVIAGKESNIDLAVKEGHIDKSRSVEAKKYFNTVQPYSSGFTNMTDLVKAKFPQANIVGDDLILRGSNSINGPNGALIVLNGSTYNWAMVKNLEVLGIKMIKILSGPAASRYGTGSGNGVMLIQLISE